MWEIFRNPYQIRFLLLGSHWGVVHLLDAMGNSLPARQLQAHTITVNQVVPSSSITVYECLLLLVFSRCLSTTQENFMPHAPTMVGWW